METLLVGVLVGLALRDLWPITRRRLSRDTTLATSALPSPKVRKRLARFLIDGKHTGSLCPSERLEAEHGEHEIETYDLVTEARRQFRVMAKDTSRSTRVRVD